MESSSLQSTDVLAYPNPAKPYSLDTDRSGVGVGCVLSQLGEEGQERPIAFCSRTLSNAEKRYDITKQEMCALVAGIRNFKSYLYGRTFTVRVDHHSLIWLGNLKEPRGILAHWLETLGSFDFTVIHRPGKLHSNADGLSRRYKDQEETTLRTLTKQSDDPLLPPDLIVAWLVALSNTDRQECDGGDSTVHVRTATSAPDDDIPESSPSRQLEQAQQEDPDLQPLLQYLDSGRLSDINVIRRLSVATRHYLSKWPNVLLHSTVLCVKKRGHSHNHHTLDSE